MSKPPLAFGRSRTAAMPDPAFSFPPMPAVSGKKIASAFDGGRIRLGGRVLLLAQAEKRPGIFGRLAAHIRGRRGRVSVRH